MYVDGKFVIPDHLRKVRSGISKGENKIQVLKDIEAYVNSRDTGLKVSDQELLSLYQVAFEHDPITTVEPVNRVKRLSSVAYGTEYLQDSFIEDFYEYYLEEKFKDSEVYRSVLSKFEFNSKGMDLVGHVETLDNIKYSTEIKDYFRIRKDFDSEHLLADTNGNITREDVLAFNFPETLTEYSGDYVTEGVYAVLPHTISDFLVIDGQTYRRLLSRGDASLFMQYDIQESPIFYEVNIDLDFNVSEAEQVFDSIPAPTSQTTKEQVDEAFKQARFQNKISARVGKSLSDIRSGTYTLEDSDVLYKGMGGKEDLSGQRINAHQGVNGVFAATDIKLAEEYGAISDINVPAGTTVEVIEVNPKGKTPSAYRQAEVEAINNSNAQIVKLRTMDGIMRKGERLQEQYIIKDENLINEVLSQVTSPTLNNLSVGGNSVFYHGSDTVRPGRLSPTTAPQFGTGIYFTTNRDIAESDFGEEVTEVQIKAENPVYTGTKEWYEVERLALKKANEEKPIDEDGDIIGEEYDLAEIDSDFISDSAVELGYDVIVDEGSVTYENEIVVLDESTILYPEDSLSQPTLPSSQLQEVIQSLVDRLSENGLSKSINLMTQEELQKVLEDLGVDATLAKQVFDRGSIWISNALNGVSKLKLQPSKPEVWVKKIAEAGGKGTTQELEWIGLQDYLNEWIKENNAKSAPKEVVEQYINDNQIEVVEVSKGNRKLSIGREGNFLIVVDENGNKLGNTSYATEEMAQKVIDDNRFQPTKYSQYTLEGGENYREVLLTLPKKKGQDYAEKMRNKYGANLDPMQIYEKMSESERETQAKLNNESEVAYKSSHWDEANILAHLRLNERTLPNGERVLFIEEVQSDWAQEGKKRGFKEKGAKTRAIKQLEDAGYFVETDRNGDTYIELNEEMVDYNDLPDNLKEAFDITTNDNLDANSKRQVPNMPYKKTDQWVGMAMRRAMQMAAQEGFDRVAWVTGEQSADRYDLSKQVDSINVSASESEQYKYNIGTVVNGVENDVIGIEDDSKLEEAVGKDLAKKISEDYEELKELNKYGDSKNYKGGDLKVGGEGMKAFYNSILPKVAKKEAQRFDKKAKVDVVDFRNDYDRVSSRGLFLEYEYLKSKGEWTLGEWNEEGIKENREQFIQDLEDVDSTNDISSKINKQLSIKITPKIKESTSKGIPLFQKNLSEKGVTPTVAGFVNQKTGDVYIDKNNPNIANTLIHEHGHLLLSHLEANNPEMYNAIEGLVNSNRAEAQPYVDFVKRTQPNLKEGTKEFNEELMAQIIGDNGSRLLESKKQNSIKQWLSDFWNFIKDSLGLSDFTADQVRNMTLKEFGEAASVSILRGDYTNEQKAQQYFTSSYADAMTVDPLSGNTLTTSQLQELSQNSVDILSSGLKVLDLYDASEESVVKDEFDNCG
jgi:hypothetical protein